MIKFISYDGKYPNLCSGTLVLEIDGAERSFKYCLSSGGSVTFDKDWNENVTSGEWIFYSDELTNEQNAEITEIVNENVRWGCCGGCV